jgi:excisionase family DNA binding protein
MNKALTVKQLAKILNVNERTIYRMASAGKIPGFKVLDSWRFLEEDIMNWIKYQKSINKINSKNS